MYKDETSAVRSHQQGLCISNACNRHTNTCRNTCNHLYGGPHYRHVARTTFGLLSDTHRYTQTDRHIEKQYQQFAIAAGNYATLDLKSNSWNDLTDWQKGTCDGM